MKILLMADRQQPPIPCGTNYQNLEEDVWVEERGIGEGGFGVVKLFVNKVSTVFR